MGATGPWQDQGALSPELGGGSLEQDKQRVTPPSNGKGTKRQCRDELASAGMRLEDRGTPQEGWWRGGLHIYMPTDHPASANLKPQIPDGVRGAGV